MGTLKLYITLNLFARGLAASRTFLFIGLFGVSVAFADILLLLNLVGQALVLGTIFDLIVCRDARYFSSTNKVLKFSSVFYVISLSIFIITFSLTKIESYDGPIMFVLGFCCISSLFLFGLVSTLKRMKGQNLPIGKGNIIVSITNLLLFFTFMPLLNHLAILVSLILSNLIGVIYIFNSDDYDSSVVSEESDTREIDSTSIRLNKYSKLVTCYFLISCFQVLDKILISNFFSSNILTTYMIAASLLVVVRSGLNLEHFYAHKLRQDKHFETYIFAVIRLSIVVSLGIYCLAYPGFYVLAKINLIPFDQIEQLAFFLATLSLSLPVIYYFNCIVRGPYLPPNIVRSILLSIFLGLAWVVFSMGEFFVPQYLPLAVFVSWVYLIATLYPANLNLVIVCKLHYFMIGALLLYWIALTWI